MLYPKFSSYAILIFMILLVLQVNVFAQQKCIFFSTGSPEDPLDTPLVDKLKETYTVDVYSIDDLGGYVDDALLHEYDFAFVSESIPSARATGLKGAPIPVFITELWGSKWDVMGWVPFNWDPDYYGTTEEDQNTVTIEDGNHALAAGFSTGTQIDVISPTIPGSGPLTYSVPQVEFVQIATLTADQGKTVVFGVEIGTALYNAVNTNDGSLVAENRTAGVGIMAPFNANITDDGWKLINAGIEWILEPTAALEENNNHLPRVFSLEQNYPNPFNPLTSIRFTLPKAGNVTLSVFNLLGQTIKTLINDQYKSQGTHTVIFDAVDLMSGVYFYRLDFEEFSASKKMILVK